MMEMTSRSHSSVTTEHSVTGRAVEEYGDDVQSDIDPYSPSGEERPPLKVVWLKVAQMGVLHIGAFYALLFNVWKCMPATLVWTVFLFYVTSLGITAGAHRLWSHRAYKARLPLRIFLALCQTIAGQTDIYNWVREHRLHHKYSDTDADPHNAKRGFFFSHIGWMITRKHPDVAKYGKKIDYSDLMEDPVVVIQRKYILPLTIFFLITMPTFLPWFFWGETVTNAFLVPFLLRYVIQLNVTWLVNSAAHMWGNRPYDAGIMSAENPVVSLLAIGEGWHNYHHVFPFDYRTGEFGWRINPTSMFIDAMAAIGQAYDLKRASSNAIAARMKRTGERA